MRRRPPRRDTRPAVHPQRDSFHEEEGEEEADLAREEILNGAPDADAQASALERADGSTRARAVQQLQREHGNAYVQRVVARHRTAASGSPRVQRDNTPPGTQVQSPAPAPAPQPGGPPKIPYASTPAFMQLPPALTPIIQIDPASTAQNKQAQAGDAPRVGSVPIAYELELETVAQANSYFESSPLEPWERAEGEYLEKRNELTDIFERKAYEVTLYILDQSEDQARKELGRYDDKANPDNPEAMQLREAAASLSAIQKSITSLLRTYAEGSMPISETGLDDLHDSGAPIVHDNGELDKLWKKLDTMRQIYGGQFPVLMTRNLDYATIAYAGMGGVTGFNDERGQEALDSGGRGELSKLADAQVNQVLDNIKDLRKELKPSKIWSLPPVVEQTKKVLGIEEGTGSNDAIEGKLSDIAWDEMVHKLGMAALQIGLQVAAAAFSGGASLAVRAIQVAATAGAVAVSAKTLYDDYQDFQFQKAASGQISLDPAQRLAAEAPGYFWLALDVVGLVADFATAASAFRNLVAPLKAANALGDATKAAKALAAAGETVAEAGAQAGMTLAEVEEMLRAQARVLKQQGKLAPGLTEDLFVERIMSSLRRQVATKGAIAEQQAGVLAKVIDGSHPNINRLLANDREALLQLLTEHGEWKSLVRGLERGGQGEIAKNLVAQRQVVVEELAADLKSASKDKQALEVSPMKGGTEDAISDIDLQIKGSDAGEMMIRAEAKMAERFGANWSEMFRLNVYTEGGRLTRYQEVVAEAGGVLKPAQKAAMTRRITSQAERLNFARMLQHAGTDPEALGRVEALAERMGVNLEEIRPLAGVDPATQTARRNELLLEVDKLQAEYTTATGARRAELGEQITSKQMEANFYTYEANISPGSIKFSGVPGLAKQEAYQAALTQLEMIEHILAASGGDVARAAREYELYKYVGRFAEVAEQAGVDTAKLKYMRNQAKTISGTQRELTEETAHLYQDPDKVRRAGITDLPQEGKALPPISDQMLLEDFESFMDEADKTLGRLNSNAPKRPPPAIAPPAHPYTSADPIKAGPKVIVAPELSESGVPKIISHTTDKRYYLVDAANPKFHVWAQVEEGGELSISMRTELDGARSEVLKGADEFKEILTYFDGQFKSIRGAWSYGTNLEKVNKVTAAGKTLEQAALETWTGQQAIQAGFGKVTVVSFEGTAGSYSKVNVLFHK